MNLRTRLLFTAIGITLIGVGGVAIWTETHTASTRHQGVVTVMGADAVWAGQTCLILAALPLAVWLPKRWVGTALVFWWLVLMAWLALPWVLQ